MLTITANFQLLLEILFIAIESLKRYKHTSIKKHNFTVFMVFLPEISRKINQNNNKTSNNALEIGKINDKHNRTNNFPFSTITNNRKCNENIFHAVIRILNEPNSGWSAGF